jgi:hypothetical protein
MDANAVKGHTRSMSGTVSSSVEKERPRLAFPGNPMVLYVALTAVLGWLGVNALMDAIRESRERDAATVQGFLDSRPADDDHRHPAVVTPVKAVPAPANATAAKQKGTTVSTPKGTAARSDGKKDGK